MMLIDVTHFWQRSTKTATLEVAEDRLVLHAHPSMCDMCIVCGYVSRDAQVPSCAAVQVCGQE